MLNAAPVLPTSSLSLNAESVQLKDEAQKKMGTFFFPPEEPFLKDAI